MQKSILFILAVLLISSAPVVQAGGVATVTFKVTCKTNKIEKTAGTQVRMTAKQGNKTLDITHLFPKGSTAQSAATYFGDKLTAAGFTGFLVTDSTITFKDVDTIDGGTGKVSQYVMTFSKGKGVTVGQAPPGAKIELIRGNPDAGKFIAAAYGLRRNASGQVVGVVSRLRTLEVPEGASSDQVIAGFHHRLSDDGWQVWLDSGNVLVVEALPDGTPVEALAITPLGAAQIFPGAAGPLGEEVGDENFDHWRVHAIEGLGTLE